jgi:hypothetical protein
MVVVAVKAVAVTGPPLTTTFIEVGLKLTPGLDGVTVYVPLATLGKLYAPLVPAVAVEMVLPFWLRLRVAALPSVPGVIVPETAKVAAEVAASTSTMVRLYRSVAGAVSLMVTVVPLAAVGAFWRCTQ